MKKLYWCDNVIAALSYLPAMGGAEHDLIGGELAVTRAYECRYTTKKKIKTRWYQTVRRGNGSDGLSRIWLDRQGCIDMLQLIVTYDAFPHIDSGFTCNRGLPWRRVTLNSRVLKWNAWWSREWRHSVNSAHCWGALFRRFRDHNTLIRSYSKNRCGNNKFSFGRGCSIPLCCLTVLWCQ